MDMSVHDEVDVLVLGAGAAGLAAAQTAAVAGAKAVVLEPATPVEHTPNVRMSGGWVMTLREREAGDRYLRACAKGLVDPERITDWADAAATKLEPWLAGLGVDLTDDSTTRVAEHPELPGFDSVRIRRAETDLPSPIAGQRGWCRPDGPARGGEAVYRGLVHGVTRAGVKIHWETTAASLIAGPDGGVLGVRLRHGATIRAGHVLIATGGYGASPEIIRNHLAVPDTKFYGNPLNDGSGLRLAVSVGATIARMNRFVGRGIASYLHDGREIGFMVDMSGGGYVICDQQGLRYTNEHPQAALAHDFYYTMQHFDTIQGGYVRSPSYYLFDQRRMDSGPLAFPDRGPGGVGLYDWSHDNGKELAEGWIGRGATPSEAAAAVGARPSDSFDRAVEEYNAGCARGVDSFGRPADTLVPLDTPPYYAIPLHVGGPHTSGGPERDAAGRILRALDGAPVPGLLGAGELGQAIGLLYPAAGCALSEALCSGLRAGATAVGL
jgi:succinate dehydrogenase/fumarate reductase flavoprotein subunit